MISDTEIARLAGMAASLRPDWPQGSIYSFLTQNVRGRAYRDVACALAWVATDPETKTPRRLLEAGPWWLVTRDPNAAPTVRPITCATCGQIHTKAEGCKRAEPVATDVTEHRAAFAAALAAKRETDLCHAHHSPRCAECGHPKPKETDHA